MKNIFRLTFLHALLAYLFSVSVSAQTGGTQTSEDGRPTYGLLNVTGSVAEGAAVYVDDRMVGNVPLNNYKLSSGIHTVKIVKPMYQCYETIVGVNEGAVTEVNPALEVDPSAAPAPAPEVKTVEQNAPLPVQTPSRPSYTSSSADNTARKTFNVNGVSFDMVFVDGGTYTMGQYDFEKHQVTLSDFYMGEIEVTQELWKAVMGNNPGNYLHYVGDNKPVCRVSWYDCQDFIKKLNSMTGVSFRLPTEAEWEYAAKGGCKSKGYKYAGSNNLDEVAWHKGNSGDTTHPVKTRKSNELGLYDMLGNIYEWCNDWREEERVYKDQINPQGPSSGTKRVLRGGGFCYSIVGCDFGWEQPPTENASSFGLRLALSGSGNSDRSSSSYSSSSSARNSSYSQSPASSRKEHIKVNGVSFEMIFVSGGTYTMGEYEHQKHQVTVSDFYMGETEVTQKLWKAVMGSNPSYHVGDLMPANSVSWDLCQDFIRKLNSMTGRRFRMPTEAEWEYAARGGNSSKGYKYAGSDVLDRVAWYGGNSGSKPHDVKGKVPNELGFYDMLGNVYEWCSDWKADYPKTSQYNPKGPSSGEKKIQRGGFYSSSDSVVKATFRSSDERNNTGSWNGLRLVMEP